MEKINAFETQGDSEEIKYGDFNADPNYDFGGEETVSASEAELILKRRKKADVTSAIITTGINAIPIVVDVFKHRKDPTPYRVNKNDLICLGISSAIPVFQAIDTVAFKGKCQDKINEKLNGSLTFNDIRNIVNLVNLYPAAHDFIKKTMNQASAKTNNQVVVPIDGFTKMRASIGLATLVTPYVSEKMSDDSKSVISRIGSVLPLPIPFIGSLVRNFVYKSNNTKAQGVYQLATAALNVANNANRTLTPAVRATALGNTSNKISSELDTALNIASQFIGSPRGSIGGNGLYGYSNNNGWNGMSF